MNTKRIGAIGAALLAASTMAACANNASGASVAGGPVDPSAPTVTIMVGGMSKQIYLPFMLAKQLGYYAKAGVDVNLVDEPAGGDATQNMLAGQVQGVGGFYDHNIALQAQGKSSEAVGRCCRSPARSSSAAATSRARSRARST
ncbi:ABC transporter substrate-binding protein [Terrabacter terrigena]|uniref:ABC transporter substrate-binding protein n=1 Tax=Terrabacter terrigena TaxID=574718 RepID=A0ABW3MZH1_9MICO